MANNRIRSVYKVTLWEPGTDTQLRQDGYGHHYDFGELFRTQQGSLFVVDPRDYNMVVEGQALYPSMRPLEFPDGVTALIANPYRRVLTGMTKAAWQFGVGDQVNEGAATWEAVQGVETWGALQLHQFHTNEDATVGSWERWARSSFDLPPEPWFAVSLWRNEPSEDHPYTQAPPFTWIDFGREFRIVFPYEGNVQLYIKGATGWIPVEAEGREEGLSTFVSTQNEPKTIHVAVVRGYILLSWDSFQQQTAFYRIPRGDLYQGENLVESRYWASDATDNTPRVWKHYVEVGHTAGEFAFILWPLSSLRHPTDAANQPVKYVTPYRNFDYKHTQPTSTVQTDAWFESRRQAWTAEGNYATNTSTVVIAPSIVTDVTTYSHAANITTQWVPSEYTSSPAYSTAISPAVFGVQLRQPGRPVQIVAPASVVLSDAADIKIHQIEVNTSEEFSPTSCRLMVHDTGSTLQTLKPYQRIQVQMGSKFEDASSSLQTVFDGFVQTPGVDDEKSTTKLAKAEIVALDGVRKLVDDKTDGREPSFDFLSVAEAVSWIAKRANIPQSRLSTAASHASMYLASITPDTESYGKSLPIYADHKRWSIETGREPLEVIQDIALAANDSQWYTTQSDRTIRLTDGYWPTSGFQYDLLESGGETSGVYRCFDAGRQGHTSDSHDFANHIHIIGRTEDGQRIDAIVRDPDSMWSTTATNFAGRWVKYVEHRDEVSSPEALFSLANTKLSELSARPDRLNAVADLIPTLRRGEIVRTSGPTDGALDVKGLLNKRYLVTGYAHSWWRGDIAKTTVTGKFVGTA